MSTYTGRFINFLEVYVFSRSKDFNKDDKNQFLPLHNKICIISSVSSMWDIHSNRLRQQLILETVIRKKYVRHHHDAQTKKNKLCIKILRVQTRLYCPLKVKVLGKCL
jgi:hypothetical protein